MSSASSQLQSSFEQKITNALSVSEFLEQGQADMPLTQLFQQLRADLQHKPFSLTLLCLTDDSRKAALKWLYGQDFAVFSVQVSAQVGLLEVHLKDRGYTLEKSTGERLDFEQWGELVQALEDSTLLEEQSQVAIATETPTAIKQLDVLVPESPEFIQQSPSLMTRILRESNVLMVAAPPNYQLTESQSKLINTLLQDMSSFLPLMPVDELAEDFALPEHGWWEQLKPQASLPVQLLTTHVDASLPSFLTDPQDDVRQSLLIQQLSKKYQSACEALADQFQDAQRQLASRKKREQRKLQAEPAQDALDSQQLMRLRTRIGDSCTDLVKALEDVCRKRELINSEQAARLKSHVESLGGDDLEKEDSYKAFKLTLDKNYQQELMALLNREARDELGQDIKHLQTEIAQLSEELTQSLNKQLGYRPSLTQPKIEKSDIWYDLEQVLAMEVRYQGEMPKRSFLDRLGAGRQALMGLMMIGMVLGGLIPELRSVLMLFGLPLFFIGMAWSFINFPKEEKSRLDKELKRVRDEVLSNARRLNSDINRQKISKVRDFMDKLKKNWQEQVEKISSDAQQRQQSDQKQQSDVAQKRLQGIDQQIQQLQQQQVSVNQLQNQAEELLNQSQQVLAALENH
ncbi:MAG: hypothetical protein K6L73_07300 [Cellvibrionaceae bacterium]